MITELARVMPYKGGNPRGDTGDKDMHVIKNLACQREQGSREKGEGKK